MKIALINGSPKARNSASGMLLRRLKTLISLENEINLYHFNTPVLTQDEMNSLVKNTIWVFAFPLYVDAIPSHLLNCLVQLEEFLATRAEREITVYVLLNCGFYEGGQNKVALEIMENWCAKAKLNWGQGVGFGSSGMIHVVERVPFSQVAYKGLQSSLTTLKDNLEASNSDRGIYLNASIPRFLYKIGVEIGWRKSILAHGRPRRDLSLQK